MYNLEFGGISVVKNSRLHAIYCSLFNRLIDKVFTPKRTVVQLQAEIQFSTIIL
jgi:hypothetical protein